VLWRRPLLTVELPVAAITERIPAGRKLRTAGIREEAMLDRDAMGERRDMSFGMTQTAAQKGRIFHRFDERRAVSG
jgi:hypothetical protein